LSVRTEEPVTKDADFGAVVSRASDYLPAERLDAIREAYEYAAICHEGQLRKTGDPYITHPVSVAYMVANLELDHQAIIAALLHDVQEDCGVSNEDAR
jgi:guanosine-3',5'-bis(diphosphate) 3'-pyrophosphohydrolase